MKIALPVLLATCSLFTWLEIGTELPVHLPPVPARFHTPPPAFTLNEVMRAVSHKHNVPLPVIRSIIAAESGGEATAVSNKGAIGLMQLMPETAQEWGADPSIPEQNIEAGTHYFRWLYNRYRTRKSADRLQCAIAAYNAGPGNVDRYKGIPPFPETQNYVKRVMAYCKRYGSSESWEMSD